MTIGLGTGLQMDLQIGPETIWLPAAMEATQNGSTRIARRGRLVRRRMYKSDGGT
jgi:hypothetical protein